MRREDEAEKTKKNRTRENMIGEQLKMPWIDFEISHYLNCISKFAKRAIKTATAALNDENR